MKKMATAVAVLVSLATMASASIIGADNAGNYTAWTNGTSGGTGFGAWAINAQGNSDSFIATTNNTDCNILTSDKAWGTWASSNTVDAYRSLGGTMEAGEIFSVSFDNGNIASGGGVGIQLNNGTGDSDVQFAVFFTGGDSTYSYSDASGNADTGMGFGKSGWNLSFALTSSTNYTATLSAVGGGATTNWSGTVDGDINHFRVYNWQANYESGGADFFINSMQAVPEPVSAALLGIGIGFIYLLRRKVK